MMLFYDMIGSQLAKLLSVFNALLAVYYNHQICYTDIYYKIHFVEMPGKVKTRCCDRSY